MTWDGKSPGEMVLHIDQWVKDNINNPYRDVEGAGYNISTKSNWSTVLSNKSKQLKNVEDGARLAGEIYDLLRISRKAMSKYSKELQLLKQKPQTIARETQVSIEENTNLRAIINEQVSTIVPDIVLGLETRILETVGKSIDDKLCAILDKLPDSNATDSLFSNLPPNRQYSEIVAEIFPKRSPEVLVLSPPSSNNTGDAKELQKEVSKNLKDVQVEFLKVNKDNGKMIVGFPNQKEKERGEKLIHEVSQLSSNNYTIKNSRKMLPKITIENVPCDIIDDVIPANTTDARKLQKEHIANLIKCKNPVVKDLVDAGHTLEVVFLKRYQQRNLLTIGIKLSPAIRNSLLNAQGGRLYISDRCYTFKDRYHFDVCYHCQDIGHISTSTACPQKDDPSTCLYCSERHKSVDCPNKRNLNVHSCARCSHSNVPNIANNSDTHNAASPNCPIIIREIKRLENNTELMSKNVM